MGLRFRKTISLLPGVRLNVSKSGVGVSAGVPGIRGSINTSGRATGTLSIPGTGLSYVKTKTIGKKSKAKTADKEKTKSKSSKTSEDTKPAKKSAKKTEDADETRVSAKRRSAVQIDAGSLKSIHSVSDSVIDWKKINESPTPPDDSYDARVWAYYYSIAPKVLGGDIDTYLRLISELNPLDDLLDYGDSFEFGTDVPEKIEVEFVINSDALTDSKKTLDVRSYNLLLQDFVCSVSLRVARDMFALLPVKNTVVHVVLEDKTIFSVDFDREKLSKINFGFIDPSNTATKFRNNMKFDEKKGFSEVIPL